MLVLISGLSASGKNTIIQNLKNQRDDIEILYQASATTRPPRDSDSLFKTYIYKTDDEFRESIENGEFIEYEFVHGNFYGTIKSAFDDALKDDSKFYIKDIDVKGCINLKKYFKKEKIITIFLDAPDEILKERLVNRGDTPEQIVKRMSRNAYEREFKIYYDYKIENLNLEDTLNKINYLLDQEKINCNYN